MLALLTFAALAHLAAARPQEPPMMGAQVAPMKIADQTPAMLPRRRLRNHCGVDPTTSRHYCSNSCGSGYQFYYCSARSFGCCHIGRGYCDEEARLRCSPFNPMPFPELRNLPRGGGPPIESGDFWHPFKRQKP